MRRRVSQPVVMVGRWKAKSRLRGCAYVVRVRMFTVKSHTACRRCYYFYFFMLSWQTKTCLPVAMLNNRMDLSGIYIALGERVRRCPPPGVAWEISSYLQIIMMCQEVRKIMETTGCPDFESFRHAGNRIGSKYYQTNINKPYTL